LWLPSREYCYKQVSLVVSLQNKRVVLLLLFYTSDLNHDFNWWFKSWFKSVDLNLLHPAATANPKQPSWWCINVV